MSSDPGLDALTATLERRQAGYRRYLKARAAVGVLLMAVGLGALLIALGIALAGLGVWSWAPLDPWVQGFSAVLATFMPAALGLISGRTGWAYWRHRRPEDGDTGCLAA